MKMRTISKIALILTAGLLIAIAVGLPFLHQHHGSVKEPVECLANIVEANLHCCQAAQIISFHTPHTQPAGKFFSSETCEFSIFEGYLFVNKAPPTS